MIQESNEDMCGMGISKQSESAKNDRYVSAGAKPEKNACKAEAQCMDNDKRRTTIRRKRTQPFTLAMIYVSYIHSGCSWGGGRGGGGRVRPFKTPPGGALKQTRHSLTKN